MPQIIIGTTHEMERFVEYTAPTLAALREVMNEQNEGTASVAQLGQAQDGSWYVVFDRALKVILTLDDIQGMQERASSDMVSLGKKTIMSA